MATSGAIGLGLLQQSLINVVCLLEQHQPATLDSASCRARERGEVGPGAGMDTRAGEAARSLCGSSLPEGSLVAPLRLTCVERSMIRGDARENVGPIT